MISYLRPWHLITVTLTDMCNGLLEAGGKLRWVFDPDPLKVRAFQESFPGVEAAQSLTQVLEDPKVNLVAAAAVPSERGPLGIQVMRAGKNYFTDKTPFTELGQLAEAKSVAAETGKKYMVYYSERLHVECAVFAGDLVQQGAIGRVVNVLGLGPHRLNAGARPAWFFERAKYGGILCDIGSHQIEQFLFFAGASDATRHFCAGGQLCESTVPGTGRFWGRHFDCGQWRHFLFSGGLADSGRSAHLGRRPDGHFGHGRLYRNAQVY